jgi:hypothetical protein
MAPNTIALEIQGNSERTGAATMYCWRFAFGHQFWVVLIRERAVILQCPSIVGRGCLLEKVRSAIVSGGERAFTVEEY